MAKQVDHKVVHYYDLHPTEEDLMGETSVHAMLVHYLVEVLTRLLQGQLCAIYENLNFYQTDEYYEYPLAPDIAVIKGVAFRHLRSWKVDQTGPAPQVVFEIASEETWKKDLREKPMRYAMMGVEEYFAYDPNEQPLLRATKRRLFGWHLGKETAAVRELPTGPDGRVWSSHLDSFLVPAGEYLRLYDRSGQLRLTEAEAEAQRAELEAEARRAEAGRAEAEARRAKMLAEKLRSLGVDPDRI
jgi:Uma2 family endonuclease